MANQLTVTGGSGNSAAPTNTSNPQLSAAPATGAAKSGSVQPGTVASQLTSQGGVALVQQPLPSVSLSNTGLQTATTAHGPTPVSTKHHFNPLLLALIVVCLVVAVGMVWTTNRSVKSTTY